MLVIYYTFNSSNCEPNSDDTSQRRAFALIGIFSDGYNITITMSNIKNDYQTMQRSSLLSSVLASFSPLFSNMSSALLRTRLYLRKSKRVKYQHFFVY